MGLTVDSSRCTGCGQCVEVCPSDAIEMTAGSAVIGSRCGQCLACPLSCPTEAITTRGAPPQDRCLQVAEMLDEQRPHREQHTHDLAASVRDALSAAGIRAHVTSRIKSPCSARDKMDRLGIPLEKLDDACGVRVVVGDQATCYAALEKVHSLWPHVPEAFDDYIAAPKANGYQSLHTVVRLACGHPAEIQIRSVKQHHVAEQGRASHWRYKHGLPPARRTGGTRSDP